MPNFRYWLFFIDAWPCPNRASKSHFRRNPVFHARFLHCLLNIALHFIIFIDILITLRPRNPVCTIISLERKLVYAHTTMLHRRGRMTRISYIVKMADRHAITSEACAIMTYLEIMLSNLLQFQGLVHRKLSASCSWLWTMWRNWIGFFFKMNLKTRLYYPKVRVEKTPVK